MQNQFDVIVVGGGVIGNASALGLAQTGLRMAHVSQDAPVMQGEHLDSRIYALSHDNVALFKRLRVWDALDASRICAVTDMCIQGDAGQHLSSTRGVLNLKADDANIAELAWIIEQNNMQFALQSALRFVPNLTSIKATATTLNILDNGVQITTETGQVITGTLLMAADGAHSWVRQAHHIRLSSFDYDQSGIVANFDCEKPHQQCAYQWFFDNGDVLALLPLPQQRVSIVYSCATHMVKDVMALDSDELSAHISALSHDTLGQLKLLTPAQAFPLKRRRADSFIAPHTLLLGDAAHTVHPLAGQGLNLGLQDLAAWLDILKHKESHRAVNDPVLLRRYARARLAPIAEMQHVTHALNRVFQHPHPLVRHARNIGMNLLDKLPPVKRRLIQSAMGQSNTTSS
ncbi:FAD-dependent monooxygenase [Hydromonas duriensis]|uniref:2-octaprenyl-3-methyl-6-methoxy-1,4-benzoquinol hydroxylase n=1 Tax=Hydromonas duriensis TaxID=1527608 RepID=A0A4R6YBP2_9BURK|nr:FAD-dependent monooxygenase [Hydromonas duriensis]TDR33021.1 2-octaprenyl-3-methyl-6-methoxy-1,4-benzoquinol hydroxylase [Hydromonas duriensis]